MKAHCSEMLLWGTQSNLRVESTETVASELQK